jgi:hypothetical protein
MKVQKNCKVNHKLLITVDYATYVKYVNIDDSVKATVVISKLVNDFLKEKVNAHSISGKDKAIS